MKVLKTVIIILKKFKINSKGEKIKIHNWNTDLKDGEEIEKRLVKYLKKKYPKTYKIEGYHKEWDIHVPEKDIRIEVKRDTASIKYTNYFIEYACDNKDSGIVVTTANYWVIYNEKNYIWIKTNVLKALCIFRGTKWVGIPPGEIKEIKAYLVPKKIIEDYSE